MKLTGISYLLILVVALVAVFILVSAGAVGAFYLYVYTPQEATPTPTPIPTPGPTITPAPVPTAVPTADAAVPQETPYTIRGRVMLGSSGLNHHAVEIIVGGEEHVTYTDSDGKFSISFYAPDSTSLYQLVVYDNTNDIVYSDETFRRLENSTEDMIIKV